MDKPIEIKKSVLVLVEGPDEFHFLREFLRQRELPEIQLLCYEGKTRLKSYLRSIQLTAGFDKVTGLGITRDADDDAAAALASIRSALLGARLPAPAGELRVAPGTPQVVVFITPGNGRPGDFEHCLLESLDNHETLGCIEGLIECIENKIQTPLLKKRKTRVWSFLATQSEPLHNVSDGAKSGVFPINHSAFDGFERMIKMITAG